MRHLILAAAAAATLTAAVPASAQVYLNTSPRGVDVQVGPRHDRWRNHHHDYNRCTTVRERIVTPSGRVIYKTRSTC